MSDSLSIISIVISTVAAAYTICFGVLPLKDYVQWLYYKFQWHPSRGTIRYKWLEDRMISATLTEENIDDIFRQVFNSVDFGKVQHTEEDYFHLLHALTMRRFISHEAVFLSTNTRVFSFGTICSVASTLTPESDKKEWKIVYEMTKLKNTSAYGGDWSTMKKNIDNMVDRIDSSTGEYTRGTLNLLIASNKMESLGYCAMLYEALMTHLNETSSNFDETMNATIRDAREKLVNRERCLSHSFF